jgi:hypothetical protein
VANRFRNANKNSSFTNIILIESGSRNRSFHIYKGLSASAVEETVTSTKK